MHDIRSEDPSPRVYILETLLYYMFATSLFRSAARITPTRRAFQITQHFQFPTRSVSRTMASVTKWDRLIRYVSAKDGETRYGDPIVSGENPDIDDLAQKGGLKVKVLEGATPIAAAPTGEEDDVKTLLGPLTPRDVPIIRCTGLNYKTHSKWNLIRTGSFFLPMLNHGGKITEHC